MDVRNARDDPGPVWRSDVASAPWRHARDLRLRARGRRTMERGRQDLLLVVSCGEEPGDRRRRNDHHSERRLGRPVPIVAAARHERAGCGEARIAAGCVRGLSGRGIQLPAHRHSGGHRARAASKTPGNARPPAPASAPLRRAARWDRRTAHTIRASLGAQQLAELLCSAGWACGSRAGAAAARTGPPPSRRSPSC